MGVLEGKVAVVTGAACGNGRGMALRFAEEGADVALADVQAEALEETAALVRERGRQARVQHCDVSKPADLERFFAAAASDLGGIDVAVANAGVVEEDAHCLTLTEAQWDRTLDVNLKGVFFTLQGAANRMLERGRGGRLIAVASIMARWGSPGTPAYAASKGGVVQLVRSFAIACGAQGITCNGIAPGFIDTPMTRDIVENPIFRRYLVDRTPTGRIGAPADVAHAAVFLASEAASFLNGHVLTVDGAITAGLYSAAAAQLAEQAAQSD